MTPVQRRLLAWYRANARALPWRRDRDPYRVWVSEIMLQQTQVSTVVGYYERFLKRFPTVQALARAEEREVLEAWAGLGYYRRARSLLEAARIVAKDHGGSFPEDPEAKLPGIGRYTRGAILSIAYGAPLPVLDGNVARVLSRLYALRGRPEKNERKLWSLAEELLVRTEPGDWNQAMMELGATVCLPASPSCLLCPLKEHCQAFEKGLQDRIPLPAARKEEVAVRLECVLCAKDGKLLIEKRSKGLLSGHWGLPEPREGLVPARLLGEVRHRITHHKVRLLVREGAWSGRRTGSALRWIAREDGPRYLVSSLWRKALELKGSAQAV